MGGRIRPGDRQLRSVPQNIDATVGQDPRRRAVGDTRPHRDAGDGRRAFAVGTRIGHHAHAGQDEPAAQPRRGRILSQCCLAMTSYKTRDSEPVRQREPVAIGISEPCNATAFTRRSPHSVRVLVHAREYFERDTGGSQRTHRGVDVVDEPPGVRTPRSRHLRHDRQPQRRAARIDHDREVILVAQRQAQGRSETVRKRLLIRRFWVRNPGGAPIELRLTRRCGALRNSSTVRLQLASNASAEYASPPWARIRYWKCQVRAQGGCMGAKAEPAIPESRPMNSPGRPGDPSGHTSPMSRALSDPSRPCSPEVQARSRDSVKTACLRRRARPRRGQPWPALGRAHGLGRCSRNE